MLLKIKRLLLLRICFNNAKHVSFTSANGRWGPIPDNETETSLQQDFSSKNCRIPVGGITGLPAKLACS
jgi:hypothetical protein